VTDFHSGDPFGGHTPSDEASIYGIVSTNKELFLDQTVAEHWIDEHNIPGQKMEDNDAKIAFFESNPNWWRPMVYISCGPFDLAEGESTELIIARVGGITKEKLIEHTDMAIDVYVNKDFQGPKSPDPPNVFSAVGETRGIGGEPYNAMKHPYKIYYSGVSEKIRLYWSDNSEFSVDPISGQEDFEGYRLYRSQDFGRTWGKPINNSQGDRTGWVPYAIFDKDDYIKGQDPYSNFYLGDDSGVVHSFIDSNIVDGYEYWYALTVYDNGFNSEGSQTQASLESSMGNYPSLPGVVACVSGPVASGATGGLVLADTLESTGGYTDGVVFVEMIDKTKLTGHQYRISFSNTVEYLGATSAGTGINIYDVDLNTYVLENYPVSDPDRGGDNIPVVDGFRVYAFNVAKGIKNTYWKTGSTGFTWGTKSNYISASADIYDDIEVVIDRSANTVGQTGDGTAVTLPLKVFLYPADDPNSPIDISNSTVLRDQWDPWGMPDVLSDGFTLTPGDASYYTQSWIGDMLLFSELPYLTGDPQPHVAIATSNGPADAAAPEDGDIFRIETNKPFRSSVVYSFSTEALTTPVVAENLNKIKVVPNPYIVKASWDPGIIGDVARYPQRKIQFRNLPEECTITIFTVAGDRVATLEHNDYWGGQNIGSTDWNLLTYEGVEAASGLYVYVVKIPSGDTFVGKFAIIK